MSHSHSDSHLTSWSTASCATLHYMTGCVIGEVSGVTLVALIGFGAIGRMGLGTLFAFAFGLYLGARSVVHSEKLSYGKALKTIFFGEIVSIAVMEIAMNAADYIFGGAHAAMTDWKFWAGFIVMLPAGFLAALPVNYLLIKSAIKDACHHH